MARRKHPTGITGLEANPESKAGSMKRLRRIEGQVRGLQKMVEGGRYCGDVLMQISSVQQALRGVARELMRHHLRHCAAHAFRKGDVEAREMQEEILTLMYRR